jgi:hypothetical protein
MFAGLLAALAIASAPHIYGDTGVSGVAESAPSYTATAASGESAFIATSGARLCFDGSTCANRLSFDGSNLVSTMGISGTTIALSGVLSSSVASNSNAVQLTSGAKLCLNGATCTKYLRDDGTYVFIAPHVQSNGDVGTISGLVYSNGTNKGLRLQGNITDGASAIQIQMGGFTSMANDGARMLVIYNNSAMTAEVFDVDEDGSIRLNISGGTKPTCSSSERGRIYMTQGGAGVKDALEVCAKDAGDAYAWRTIY